MAPMDTRDQEARDAEVEAALRAWREREGNISKEEVDKLWEAAWVAIDFSWDGLADAGWDRGEDANAAQKLKRWRAPADFPNGGTLHDEGDSAWREATLQDYWRWSPTNNGKILNDNLIKAKHLLVRDSKGRLWHALHRPDVHVLFRTSNLGSVDKVRDDVVNPALGKLDSNTDLSAVGIALADLLLDRLATAKGKQFYESLDCRAQIVGARATGIDLVWRTYGLGATDTDRNPIRVNAAFSELESINARGLLFGDGTGFQEVNFGHEAQFQNATFANDISFNRANFGSLTYFEHAVFGNGASFAHASFGTRTRFDHACFGDWAKFDQTVFGDRAVFVDAKFGHSSGFHDTTFGNMADFGGTTFGEGASFWKTLFGHMAGFSGVSFGAGVWFKDITFGDDAEFSDAKFLGESRFELVRFGYRAEFVRAEFRDNALVLTTEFGDSANFKNANFYGLSDFSGSHFEGPICFDGSIFSGAVSFKGVKFLDKIYNREENKRVSFRAAIFREYVDFSGAIFPQNAAQYQSVFEGARFREPANFKCVNFSAFAAFDGAVFERRLMLSEPGESAYSNFRRAIKQAQRAVDDDEKVTAADDYDPDKDQWRNERGAAARFGALEGGLRTLKLAMRQQSDHVREQRFFEYELRARQKNPSTPRWEAAASRLYGWASSYGNSILRPLGWLGGLCIFCAALFWVWGNHLNVAAPDWPSVVSAFDLSFRNVFRPFDVWSTHSAVGAATSLAEKIHANSHGLGWLALRVVASLQSISALLLVFFVALALRRRFRIA
jgi:hypothetical protein